MSPPCRTGPESIGEKSANDFVVRPQCDGELSAREERHGRRDTVTGVRLLTSPIADLEYGMGGTVRDLNGQFDACK